MAAKSIRALKGQHAGATIVVVASGRSVDFLPPAIFQHQIIVAVNEMFRHVPSSFVLMHHTEHAQEAIDAGCHLVTSDRAYDMPPRWGQPPAFRGDYSVYRTAGYEMSLTPTIDVARLETRQDDELVVSACTTAEAIQFAAHLGASVIVLCGVDGGSLDGHLNINGYNGGGSTNPQHCRLTEPILLAVATHLRARGVAVVSLNPFINFGLEGHIYQRPQVLTGHQLITALNTVHATIPSRDQDARHLVTQAVAAVEPEPYDRGWQSARIEAAVRRVIVSLGPHVPAVVRRDCDAEP